MWTPQGTGVRGPRRNAEAGAALWMEETEPEGRQGPSRRESVTLSQPEQLINEISRVWRAHRQSPQTAAFHGSETRNTGQGAAEKQLTGLGGPTPQEAPRCPRAPLHRSRSCGSRRQRVTTACPGPMSGRRGKPPVLTEGSPDSSDPAARTAKVSRAHDLPGPFPPAPRLAPQRGPGSGTFSGQQPERFFFNLKQTF